MSNIGVGNDPSASECSSHCPDAGLGSSAFHQAGQLLRGECSEISLSNSAKKSSLLLAPTFGQLAASFLTHETCRFAPTTAYTARHNLKSYLLPRWSTSIAVDIQPLEIEDWFEKLRKQGLADTTVAKIRAIMIQVYRHSQRVGLISRREEANPVQFARASGQTTYRPILMSPKQAIAIIAQLDAPEQALAFLSAATGLRISESLGLKWSDIDFAGKLINVRRTWLQGKVGKPKTKAAAAPVPLGPALAKAMSEWRATTDYGADEDWVFASHKTKGKQPREGGVAAADYLRPAAIRAGVISADYVGRFGWHNFRHSLAHYLVRSGTDPKVVQGLLRHAKVQTTLNLYTQSVPADGMAAQARMIRAMMPFSKNAQVEA